MKNDMNKAEPVVHKEITKQMITDAFTEMNIAPAKDRVIKLMTDRKGMEIYDREMKKHVRIQEIDWLFRTYKITEQEQISLKDMINGNDPESYNLAKMLIERKLGWDKNIQDQALQTVLPSVKIMRNI